VHPIVFQEIPLRYHFLSIAAALCFAAPLQASATLGGDASTPAADQLQLKAVLRVSPGARYNLHELTLPTGTTVREYVNPQGQVFAVAWKGPFKPDLRQLMGGYFDRYVQSTPSFRGGHSAARIAMPDLVVQSSGHLRAFSGHAYLPQMLPADVAESELK
jgi:hypothetical protein